MAYGFQPDIDPVDQQGQRISPYKTRRCPVDLRALIVKHNTRQLVISVIMLLSTLIGTPLVFMCITGIIMFASLGLAMLGGPQLLYALLGYGIYLLFAILSTAKYLYQRPTTDRCSEEVHRFMTSYEFEDDIKIDQKVVGVGHTRMSPWQQSDFVLGAFLFGITYLPIGIWDIWRTRIDLSDEVTINAAERTIMFLGEQDSWINVNFTNFDEPGVILLDKLRLIWFRRGPKKAREMRLDITLYSQHWGKGRGDRKWTQW